MKDSKDFPYGKDINQRLIIFRSRIEALKTELYIQQVEPTPEALKDRFNNQKEDVNENQQVLVPAHNSIHNSSTHVQKKKEKDNSISFFDAWNKFVQYAEEVDGKQERTIQAYTSTRDHLYMFEKTYLNYKIEMEQVNTEFLKKFERYLSTKHVKFSEVKWDEEYKEGKIIYPDKKKYGVTDSSKSKDLKCLKTFLIWANKKGMFEDREFIKEIKVQDISADIVVLTKEELQTIAKTEVPKELELYKDIYLIGSTTGLRISDLVSLRETQFHLNSDKPYIRVITLKTNQPVQLPLLPFIADIFKKYDCKFPVLDENKVNENIKIVGKIAGFKNVVEKTFIVDKKQVVVKKPLYEFIDAHQMRRNFISLMIKAGLKAEEVMDLTGHKDYKSFKKYLKFHDEDRFRVIQKGLGDLF